MPITVKGGWDMPGLRRIGAWIGLFAVAIAMGAVSPVTAQGKPDPSWPKNLTLGTASVGGTYFVYGQVWASLVNEKLGTNISHAADAGPEPEHHPDRFASRSTSA